MSDSSNSSMTTIDLNYRQNTTGPYNLRRLECFYKFIVTKLANFDGYVATGHPSIIKHHSSQFFVGGHAKLTSHQGDLCIADFISSSHFCFSYSLLGESSWWATLKISSLGKNPFTLVIICTVTMKSNLFL